MWNEVEDILLQSNSSAIMQTAVNRDGATCDYHDRGEIERVKSNPGNGFPSIHNIQRKSKDVSSITAFTFQLKMYPAKHQGKGNQRGDYATPHDQLMH